MTRLLFPLPIGAVLADVLGLHSSIEVARAQLGALTQRVPYLYAILGVNVSALAFTHYHSHPAWQVILVPCVLLCVIAARLIRWIRLPTATMTDRQVRRVLQDTVRASLGLGALVLGWAISLHLNEVAVPRRPS